VRETLKLSVPLCTKLHMAISKTLFVFVHLVSAASTSIAGSKEEEAQEEGQHLRAYRCFFIRLALLSSMDPP
jgi:hypothetical protein